MTLMTVNSLISFSFVIQFGKKLDIENPGKIVWGKSIEFLCDNFFELGRKLKSLGIDFDIYIYCQVPSDA